MDVAQLASRFSAFPITAGAVPRGRPSICRLCWPSLTDADFEKLGSARSDTEKSC